MKPGCRNLVLLFLCLIFIFLSSRAVGSVRSHFDRSWVPPALPLKPAAATSALPLRGEGLGCRRAEGSPQGAPATRGAVREPRHVPRLPQQRGQAARSCPGPASPRCWRWLRARGAEGPLGGSAEGAARKSRGLRRPEGRNAARGTFPRCSQGKVSPPKESHWSRLYNRTVIFNAATLLSH